MATLTTAIGRFLCLLAITFLGAGVALAYNLPHTTNVGILKRIIIIVGNTQGSHRILSDLRVLIQNMQASTTKLMGSTIILLTLNSESAGQLQMLLTKYEMVRLPVTRESLW